MMATPEERQACENTGWTTITVLRKHVAFAKRLSMRHWLEVSQQVTRLRRCRIPMMLSADF